jgi:NAD(P)-dependent dehydrogenase (short-subunit alcohol dehydrogenase family)
MVPPVEMLTRDGYDLQFGTNVIGHFLLTTELLPLLEAGAQSSSDKTARIVNTSSSASVFYTINWNALNDTPERKRLGNQILYAQSKFVSKQARSILPPLLIRNVPRRM